MRQKPLKMLALVIPSVSVKKMMILVLLIGGATGWFINSVRTQRNAASIIEAAGGYLVYDCIDYGEGEPKPFFAPPQWLIDRVGIDYFGNIIFISMGSTDNDNESCAAAISAAGSLRKLNSLDVHRGQFPKSDELECLAMLTRIRCLNLATTDVSDTDLAKIGGMARLEELDLSRTKIGNAGLVHLAKLRNLKKLDLSETLIDDAGVAELAGLDNLTELSLGDNRITEVGLARLASHVKLQKLNVRNNKIALSDQLMADLGHLVNLVTLDIWGSNGRLSSTGVGHLAGLSQLQELCLGHASLRDADVALLGGLGRLERLTFGKIEGAAVKSGISALARMPALRSLSLHDTEFGDADLAQFKNLTNITKLAIRGPEVTDKGLPQFAEMTHLETIYLMGSKVSNAATKPKNLKLSD